MYRVAVFRDFVAQHFLFGGDWGRENRLHSHHYRVEVCLEGQHLDKHGYLLDIVEVKNRLEELVNYFRDHTLNELPEFSGLNPSIEHFSRIFCQKFATNFRAENIFAITVKIWENEIAWASYRQQLDQ
ncbi:MAG: 6-carboxytetrahydropterin synthase [Calditrichia bacterium]